MVFHLKNIGRVEYTICCVIWFSHYFYILAHAALELNMVYKERYVKKRLLRRGWLGQVLHLDTEFLRNDLTHRTINKINCFELEQLTKLIVSNSNN